MVPRNKYVEIRSEMPTNPKQRNFRYKLRIIFREPRGCKLQENVILYPPLKLADRQQDALGLVGAAVLLLIASGEGFFLLRGLQLRQQERVAGADLVLQKRLGHCGYKLREPDTGKDV